MRVAVLLEERCKPNSNAFAYLKKYCLLYTSDAADDC